MNQLSISEYNPRMEYCDNFQFVVLAPSRVWGRHVLTRSCPKGAGNFQELKICGHGTILALMNNRKLRTAQLIQPTVLGFLLSGQNTVLRSPCNWTGGFFVILASRTNSRNGRRPLREFCLYLKRLFLRKKYKNMRFCYIKGLCFR